MIALALTDPDPDPDPHPDSTPNPNPNPKQVLALVAQLNDVQRLRVEADASAFNPSARGATSRLRAFRARALYNNAVANAGAVDRHARRSLLFVSRVGSRRVATNEASLLSRLQAATVRVQRVVLEELPFAEQMSLVASSAARLYLRPSCPCPSSLRLIARFSFALAV